MQITSVGIEGGGIEFNHKLIRWSSSIGQKPIVANQHQVAFWLRVDVCGECECENVTGSALTFEQLKQKGKYE